MPSPVNAQPEWALADHRVTLALARLKASCTAEDVGSIQLAELMHRSHYVAFSRQGRDRPCQPVLLTSTYGPGCDLATPERYKRA